MRIARNSLAAGCCLAALVFAVASCGGSARLSALEDRNPVISDLQIEGATRTDRLRSNGEGNLLEDRTPLDVFQFYTPDPDSGLKTVDLYEKALAAAEAEGWQMDEEEPDRFSRRACGTNVSNTDRLCVFIPEDRLDRLTVYLYPAGS